ncbi:MAG: IS66 family transposase [bacterium]|nr:IS66 family transposase [bacterium]
MAIQQRVAQSQQATGANQPSATIPPYEKNNASNRKSKHKRKRGGKPGHQGTRRPTRIPDRTREHQCENCPDCGGKLKRTDERRDRFSEDIPEDLKSVVTKDVIHRDYCPKCQKRVEPRLPDVLPNCTLGNRTLVLSALLHFLQGLTISQIVDTFNFHLRMKLTPGGLVQLWHRLADILFAWYEEIHRDCLASAKLHADETGWRVNGQTHWLCCFAGVDATFYMIDRSRGSPAISKFFVEHFDGVLITDFWSPYDAISCADQQKCWPHLLRDAAEVDKRHSNHPQWTSFCRRLVSVYRAAKKLHARRDETPDEYDLKIVQLENRLLRMANESWEHADARRLAKRLGKYGTKLLTFLWYDDVPMDNNAGERAIRPAVMIRKNSYANGSERGALKQSVLMTIFRTLKQRKIQPIEAILTALTQYNQTGQLPPLPKTSSNG